MIFTPKQIHDLLKVIGDFHTIFVSTHVGIENLSFDEIAVLRSYKIPFTKYPSTVDYAFKFGILAHALGDERVKDMTFEQFKGFLKSKDFIPLTAVEKEVLNNLKYQFYSDIKGLGNKVSHDFKNVIVEADKKQRSKYEKIIRNAARRAVENRASVKQMVREIGMKTGDWARDLNRIADTILHDAYDSGRAQAITKMYGDDALVYKRVHNDACEDCKKAFWYKNGVPKIFKLKEILANGTNIGRKKKDWKPTVASLHPRCRCELTYVPVGATWDKKKKLFVVTELQSERAKQIARRLKVKVVKK